MIGLLETLIQEQTREQKPSATGKAFFFRFFSVLV